jgi:hypothetical protein
LATVECDRIRQFPTRRIRDFGAVGGRIGESQSG